MNSRNLSGWLGRIFRSMLPAVALATAALSPATGWSQEENLKPHPHQFVSIASCQRCHASQMPPGELLEPQDFIMLDEFHTFQKKDKHAQAYELIAKDGGLGEQMRKQLGITDISKAHQCLSCHANWHYKEGFAAPQFMEFGVTCESCHGPGEHWEQPHTKAKEWRSKTAADKLALGMVEVRNPVDRAKQCFSCHIGNAAEGKVVTHDMYAAGHPPLPGIEVETFAESMPSHWRNLKEKGNFLYRGEYLKANFAKGEAVNEDLPRFKNVVFGGIIALRENVNLIATQAQTEEKSWPELAVFDCAACHHELRIPSWRQKRANNAQFKPGRPQSTLWPSALVKLGVAASANGDMAQAKTTHDQLSAALAEFRAALDSKPFGDPAAMRPAADKVISLLDTVTKALEATKFDKGAAEKSLEVLTTLGPDESPDFHSARQMAWAYQVIYTEMNAPYPTFADKADVEKDAETKGQSDGKSRMATAERVKQDLATLAAWRKNTWDASAANTLNLFAPNHLEEKLLLRLPAGNEYEIGKELPRQLEAIGNYDQYKFLKALLALPTK